MENYIYFMTPYNAYSDLHLLSHKYFTVMSLGSSMLQSRKNGCTDMVTSIHQGNEEFVTKSDMRQGFCLNLSLSPLLLYWKT